MVLLQPPKIKILDDDAPELSITAGSPVFESNSAQAEFIISTKVRPNGPINIDYTPTSVNYLTLVVSNKKVTDHTLIFTGNGPYVDTIKVQVDDDFTAEAKGEITLTLNQKDPIAGYTVASSPNNSAAVDVFDDDFANVPTISISAEDFIYEGDNAVFEFAVSESTAEVSKVRVRISESGYFLTTSALAPRIVDIEIVNGTGKLVEATQPDSITESEGTITITVLPDPEVKDTYTAIPEVSKTVRILDNDGKSPPSITIFARQGITEGENQSAMFTLVSAVGSDNSITSINDVKIEITQVGNYLANGAETITEVIENLGTPKTISIGIIDDQYDEEVGLIIARVLSDTHSNQRWSVGSADRASVTVTDNDDEPTLMIESVVIDEGNYPARKKKMEFEVKLMNSSGIETKSGKEVSVRFATTARTATPYDEITSPDGDFLMQKGILNFAPVTLEANSGESTKKIEVAIVGDTADEADEILMVMLSEAVNATISEENGAAEGMIRNDDRLPFVSIHLENDSTQIIEGSTLNILLKTGTNAPTTDRLIRVSLRAKQTVGDYIAFRIPRSVVMNSNQARFNIYTIDDLQFDGHGTIKITIFGTGQNFVVDPEKSFIEVNVSDNDKPETQDVRISVASVVANNLLRNAGAFSGTPELSRAPTVRILQNISAGTITSCG